MLFAECSAYGSCRFIFARITYAIARLVLISLGRKGVIGMMQVINLAHGEFLMLGGYAAVISRQAGLNIWLAMPLIVAPPYGRAGRADRRAVDHPVSACGRMLDTMLATWGWLCLIGLVTLIFGINTDQRFSTPFGLADRAVSVVGYNLFIIVVAAVMLAGIYACCYVLSTGPDRPRRHAAER